ncbi:MAG TPA: Xaa-Pro peptidase family protein [Solirubrobacteraceae bacterium]|jgi:Xaa-Pro aminopeptidase|nr:Xaa-Pro peptidase family protein [Solirubrobacteraceae bacterium]
MSARLDALAAAVAERELDAVVVSNLVDVRWLTGFTGSNALVVLGATQRRFVTDFRYLTQAAEQLDEVWEREIATELLRRAVEGLPADQPLRLGFDDANLTVKQHAQLVELVPDAVELVAAGGIVEKLRAVKDAGEIDAIRAAVRLADEALEEVLAGGIVGRSERDVALDVEFAMRRRGAQGASFAPIVAAGQHGAHVHAQPRDVAIAPDTLVVIDWGAHLDGYASDCTRTFATGELDPRDREIYDLVLTAQEAALAAVRAGPTGKEIDAIARTIIERAGHGEHFGHGLGHGIGLEVHEGPRLSKQGEDALAAGNVVTVEPGVYVPGAVGVRIEDLVVVTEDGCTVLSGLPKSLRVVQ